MKKNSPLLLFLLILFFSCKKENKTKDSLKTPIKTNFKIKPKQNLENVVIKLNKIKSRKNISIKKQKFNTEKTAIYTTFADSLEVIKRTFFNETPLNETITYKIPKESYINFTIDATLEKYNYFLKAGDNLTIYFDDNGFISKSILNGSENDASLLFSKNSIPIKTIEYLKLYKKTYGRVNEKRFSNQFEKKFRQQIDKVTKKIRASRNTLDTTIYKALKKHLQHTNIANNYSKGIEKEIPYDDFSMSIYSYRDLRDKMLLKISNISYLDDEKSAIKESIKMIDFLMNDTLFKAHPKTRNMIMRELIERTGQYEPNLIPELIAKIPDTKIKQEYLKTYTNQYLLELKEYQNDTKNINLISIKDQKNIFTFQDFLDINKGKVIYIDLWASWCAPCRKQLISSNKLRKELNKYPIVFGYLSTDKSFAQWKTAQLEEEMNEEPNSFLLLNTKKSAQYKSWNVRGIPRYLIFDKTGKLVVKNAPIPSDPKAKKELLKYI